MTTARFAALSLALTALLPACGPELKGGEDPEMEADVTLEGEVCASPGKAADCRVDGDDGVQVCQDTWKTGESESTWAACLTESCDAVNEARACEGGQQYCVSLSTDLGAVKMWGVCTGEAECTPGETRDCGFADFDLTYSCILDDNGVPGWDPFACNTPLVLSFGAPVEFAPTRMGAADFDIHGGPGVCTRADWPSPATPWLALDLDKNGSIDGGHELFGSGTRLAAGTGSPNGFAALAPLDSDRDGKITPADERWGELVLWADHDGDRRSSGWEMLPLASFEVVEIDLAYGSRRECDAAGNCGVERAAFVYRQDGRAKVGEVVDVHLACE